MSIQTCVARLFCVVLTAGILSTPDPAAARDAHLDPRPKRRERADTASLGPLRTGSGGGITLDRLSKGHVRVWREIAEVVGAADASGRPRSPTLRWLWNWAHESPHVLHVEMVSPSRVPVGVAGEFRVERVDPSGLAHVVVVQLCPGNIRRAEVGVGPNSVRSFVRFEGLSEVERYAEVLAHELAHAEYFLASPERLAGLDAARRTRAEFLSGRERVFERLSPELRRRLNEASAVLAAGEAHAEAVEAVVLEELSGERPARMATARAD